MTQSYYSIITNNGLLKEAAANAPGGSAVDLTHIAVGDANGTSYNPTGTQTALVHEVYRTTLTHVAIDETNPNQLIVEGVISETVGPFYIREVGIFDSDGQLFAVGKYPETFKSNSASGSGKRLYIRMILGFTNAPQVNLIISEDINNDPNFGTNVNNALADINNTLEDVDEALDQKLTKTQNLADLQNASVARENLSLKNGAITDFTGAIMAFAMSTPPAGWLECYGAAILISTYPTLASAIYCGDTNNATALWGYKCTNPANPTGSRNTSGQYIVIPDLRGEFIRGWDHGRGVDSGRSFGSFQDDAFQGHYHNLRQGTSVQGGTNNTIISAQTQAYIVNSVVDPITDGVHGTPKIASETRPRNIALMYCIKY